MTERHYSDEETREIFRAASQGPDLPATTSRPAVGFTLAELQAIGGEAGIAPDAVARAARMVDARPQASSRRLLGLPIGIERRVALGRKLTDEEWEHLVVQFRDVFKARGRMKSDGSFKQWTNGNLYALLEPTPSGHRLRLGSLHGGAAFSIRMGILALASAGMMALVSAFGGDVGNAVSALLTGGGVLLANGALRVPGWARLRGKQMEDLATRLVLPAGTTLPLDSAGND